MFSRGRQERELGDRLIQLMALFAPGIAAAGDDPRAILSWQPLAVMARKLFPEECAELDQPPHDVSIQRRSDSVKHTLIGICFRERGTTSAS